MVFSAGVSKLRIQILAISAIDASLKHELYSLFEKYYVDVSYEMFVHDLSEKTHVLLLRDPARARIAGFSTVLRKRMPEVGRGVFLFSGDTVVHQDYWGTQALQIGFFRYLVASKLQAPLEPLYWMLISKGYKTYLLMRRNFPLSFPNENTETPEEFKKVAAGFYRHKFGNAYSPGTELIRFETSHGAVKGKIAAPCDADLGDPAIAFFARRNPDYASGVELACVAEVRFRDFAAHFNKYVLGRKPARTAQGDGIARGELLLPRAGRLKSAGPSHAKRPNRASV